MFRILTFLAGGFFKKVAAKRAEDMTFLEHFEEMRMVIVRTVIFIVIASIVAFFFKDFIYDVVVLGPKQPGFITYKILCQLGGFLHIDAICISPGDFRIVNNELAGQFRSHMKISFISGLIVAVPYLIFELWNFIKPALQGTENKYIGGFLVSANLLFIIGVLFGYYLITPLAVNFLATYTISDQVENLIVLGSYIGTVSTVSLSTGLVFEMPVLIFFLTKLGIVTPMFLKKQRKIMIVVIFIIGAIITPPDVFSQCLVSFPMIGLYEISIVISKRVYKKKNAIL